MGYKQYQERDPNIEMYLESDDLIERTESYCFNSPELGYTEASNNDYNSHNGQ
jgi:hypothetical protein